MMRSIDRWALVRVEYADDILCVAPGERSELLLGTRLGALIAWSDAFGSKPLHKFDSGVSFVGPPRSQGRIVVLRRGAVVEISGRNTIRSTIADETSLYSWVEFEGDDVVVGTRDQVDGVLYRRSGRGDWIEWLTPGLAMPGLLGARLGREGELLVFGQRGFVAANVAGAWRRTASGTEHSIRSCWPRGGGRWLCAGGGWAQRMPCLLALEHDAVTVLEVAGPERVLTGVVEDLDDAIWYTANVRTEQGWDGCLYRYGEDRHEVVARAEGCALFGLECVGEQIVAFGEQGVLLLAHAHSKTSSE